MKNLAYKEVDESRGQLSDTPKVRRIKNDLVDCAGMIASDWIAQTAGTRTFEQPNYIRDPFTGRIIG
jgi:hypothetical protein